MKNEKQSDSIQEKIELEAKKAAQVAEKEQVKQLIIAFTEEKIEKKYTDEALDRETEKIKLIGGTEYSIAEINAILAKLVLQSKSEYDPIFTNEFYTHVHRLNGWEKPENLMHQHPPIVGRYTNEIIYGRFPKEVLPMLQGLNPYIIAGLRMHKHFQFLTNDGKQKVAAYIEDSVRLMKISKTWYEFRLRYTREFGIPFQLSLFDVNNID